MGAQGPGGVDLMLGTEDRTNYAYYKIRVNIVDGSSMDLYLKSTGGVSIDKVPEVILHPKGQIIAKDDIKINIESITKKEYSKYLEK